MERLGLINTVAYSLWLNNLDAAGGSLLFGGIDTEKYVGNLKVVPVLKNHLGKYDYFGVAMAGISVGRGNHDLSLPCHECSIRAVLDSGATLSFLPNDLAHAMWEEAGVKWSSNLKAPMLPCSRARGREKFAFHFGDDQGPTIKVRIGELVIDSTKWPNASGDSFLRSAYLVHDLVNHEVGMAETLFNATRSGITPFPSYGARIPVDK
ncbi:aspartic-type endopeptidase opsB like protein [Verticillium longisporum]|nr:aspartic-type endopeptidase opsB like protein [Verticillium longisporum]